MRQESPSPVLVSPSRTPRLASHGQSNLLLPELRALYLQKWFMEISHMLEIDYTLAKW